MKPLEKNFSEKKSESKKKGEGASPVKIHHKKWSPKAAVRFHISWPPYPASRSITD